MSYPVTLAVGLPGGGAVVAVTLPDLDLVVAVQAPVDLAWGWALDGGGAIVAPVDVPAGAVAHCSRRVGGAPVVYLVSGAAGDASVWLVDDRP